MQKRHLQAFLVRAKPASAAWAVATVAIDKALSDNAFCLSSRSGGGWATNVHSTFSFAP
jgi:hypothetical protein